MTANKCSVNHFYGAVVLSLIVVSGWEDGEYGLWCYTHNRNTDMNFWPRLQMERDSGSMGRECRLSHSIAACSLGINPWCVVCYVSTLYDLPGTLVWSGYWIVRSSYYWTWFSSLSLNIDHSIRYISTEIKRSQKACDFLVFERHFHKNKKALLVSIWQLNEPGDRFTMVEGHRNYSDQSG